MIYNQEITNEDISLSIPIKISFKALRDYLNKEFEGKLISRNTPKGKEINYFKILDIDIAKSDLPNYNLELRVNLETLTTFYNKRELQISVQTLVNMDLDAQKIYIETYKINSTGKSWVVNQILESVVNTFIYRKIINSFNIEIIPLINEKLIELNEKLASKIEVKSGISIIGALKSLTITHFEVKDNDIWVIININGWGIMDIESLEL